MEYVIYSENLVNKKGGIISRLLQTLLPSANPDYAGVCASVVKWFLEIDEENGKVKREIGMNGEGKPIVIGPWRNNRGLWTDSPISLDPGKYKSLPASEFTKLWNKYIRDPSV